MPEAAATRRLFLALFPDPEVLAAAIEHGRGWRWPRQSRITGAERLHLTLHFLDEVQEGPAAALQAALAEVKFGRFALVLDTPQVLRNGVGVLMPRPEPALDALHDTLGQLLPRVGLRPPEARWKPHLTLARQCAGAQPPAEAVAIAWPVSEFVLVASRRSPPVRYERLASYRAATRPMG